MGQVIAICRRWFGVMVLAPALAACSAKPLAPTIVYHPTAGDRTVVLLTPYVPSHDWLFSVTPVTTVGALGGLLGYAYDQTVQKDHEKAFDALLARQGFKARALLRRAIRSNLQADGYTVVGLAVERPKRDFLAAYPPAPPGDALELDVVVVHIGYVRFAGPYQPEVELKYRLVRASNGQVLGEGAVTKGPDWGKTSTGPKYGYSGYDRFATDPSRAATALTDLVGQAGASIAAGLR